MYPFQDTHIGDLLTVRVCVEDTGIGIPEDEFKSIFENFSRLTSFYQGIYKGPGLGLYSVKKYVEGTGGDISLESVVGQGSKFFVDIPLIVSDHTDSQQKEEADIPISVEKIEDTQGSQVSNLSELEQGKDRFRASVVYFSLT